MVNTLLRFGAAATVVALMVSVVGTAGRAHADTPGFGFGDADLSGIGDLGKGFDNVGKLPPQQAQPPASPVEQPAAGPTTGTTGAAPSLSSVPAGGAAPQTLALPNTGTGSSGGGDMPMLALAVAIAGFACAGAAFKVRAESVRA
jgi:predicted lipid-binding transport protein (Tim44 family)